MTEELIDSSTGDGKVFDGADLLAEVEFTLETYKASKSAATMEDRCGTITASARHRLVIHKSSRILPIGDKTLTLHIAGVVKLNFMKTSASSNEVSGTFFQ